MSENEMKQRSDYTELYKIDNQQTSNLTNGCHTLNVERWSCSPVRRKSRERTIQRQSAHDCACNHGDTCNLLNADTPVWGDNSDSGQGTSSQPIGKSGDEVPHTNHDPEDSCETDPDDTSAFDYSSVTSCSPESTLRMGMAPSASGEEDEEEEDSQVPVLLKPTCTQQQQMRDTPRERTVCVRWQIPRLTPHPPLRNPTEGLTPCLVKSHGKRLVSIRKGSPPLHRKSAFRPIWDDPARQGDTAPEKDNRQSFMPVPVPGRPAFQNFNTFRPGMTQQPGGHAGPTGNSGIWDDSEDSEGPCSTV